MTHVSRQWSQILLLCFYSKVPTRATALNNMCVHPASKMSRKDLRSSFTWPALISVQLSFARQPDFCFLLLCI